MKLTEETDFTENEKQLNRELPKIKEEFLPLVKGFRQIDINSRHHDYMFEVQTNSYSVNAKGELILLNIVAKTVLDFALLAKCSALESLYIENSELTTFPEEISKLKKLKTLDLSGNQLSQLPDTLIKLQSLKGLILERNQFKEIPNIICKMNSIVQIQLNSNKLSHLPPALTRLKKLLVLFIQDNNFTDLPLEIGACKSLRYLFIGNNQLKTLPDSIGNLNNLDYLSVHDNQLTSIPESMLNLKSLKDFDIRQNPLPIPDPLFHELTGQEKIQTLLALQKENLQPLKQAKILVVGDERVGKTSVINRLLGKPHNDNQTSTQGIDISELNFGNFLTNIWDFAGQELTHQTHQFFLTERSLYIYVLDAQKEDNQARDLHWLNTIKSYSENSPIIIVANHSDQNINYRFDRQRYQSEFQIVDVIYSSACNLNALSEQIKSRLGDSIENLRQTIIKQLPKLPGIESKLPENWHQVKNAMEAYKQHRNVIEKDVYEEECKKYGIEAKPLQTALLKILNSIGTVVAYPNDFRLKLTQILKPEWVTNAVYQIVRGVSKTQGIYSEDEIGEILNGDYNHTHQQWLIDLLIKFELGFRLLDNNELLIPMRLPSVMPVFDKPRYQKGLNIRFNYFRRGLLKLNVLPQLIVRMHDYIDPETNKYWRHGMFIKLKDCQGVVIADEPNQSIEVFLTGRNENARTLLQWIRTNLCKVEESQIKASNDKSLPFEEEIALFDSDYSNVVGYTNISRIERFYEKGVELIPLEVTDPKTGKVDDKDFSVAELLGLYRNKNNQQFKPSEFTKFLVKVLLGLTDSRAKILDEQEDDINDRLRHCLNSGGFSVADQSRGGFSGSGQGVGERDLVVLDQYGQQASIIEAMILKSAVTNTITSHYQKLVHHYNTQGNPCDFLVTYAKVKSIDNLWKNYQKHMENFDDITQIYSSKLNLKVGKTTLQFEGTEQTREIVHIMVNFGVQL